MGCDILFIIHVNLSLEKRIKCTEPSRKWHTIICCFIIQKPISSIITLTLCHQLFVSGLHLCALIDINPIKYHCTSPKTFFSWKRKS